MAAYLSTELGGSANQTAAPVGYKPAATVYGGRLRRLRSTFTAASQATTDTLVVGTLPAGATFALGVLTASATFGATCTLAVGITGTTGKYRAAAVTTAVDAPAFFGPATIVGAAAANTAEEQVIVTIAAAAMPAAGTLVIDLYYSMP